MKSSVILRRIVGILLIAFSALYLVAAIRVQLSATREQTALYQNQIVIKDHALRLAKEISDYADRCDNGSPLFIFKDFQDHHCGERAHKIADQMEDEGLNVGEINFLLSQLDTIDFNYGYNIEANILQRALRQIADELKRVANELPTS